MGRHLRGGSVGAGRPGGGRERGNVRARRRRPRDQGVPRGVPRVAPRFSSKRISQTKTRKRPRKSRGRRSRTRCAPSARRGTAPACARLPRTRSGPSGLRTRRWRRGSWRGSTTKNKRSAENRRCGARKDAKRRVFVFVCFRAFVLQSRGGFRELTGAFEARARRDARVPVRGERRGRRVRVRVGPRARPRRASAARHAKQSRRGSASVAGRQRARRRRRDAERRDGVRQDLAGGHREHHAILRERRVRAGVGRAGGAVRAWRDQARLATLWPGLGCCSARRRRAPRSSPPGRRSSPASRRHSASAWTRTTPRRARRRLARPTAARGRRRGWVEVESEAEEEEAGDETPRVADTDTKPKPKPKPKPKEDEPSAALALRARLLNACFPEEQGVDRWTRFGKYPEFGASRGPQAAARHPLVARRLSFRRAQGGGARGSGKPGAMVCASGCACFGTPGGGRSLKALERGIGSEIRASLERHVSADESDLAAVAIACLVRWGLPTFVAAENAERVFNATSTDREDHEARAHQLKPHG